MLKGDVMETKKLEMKLPPSALYCPICNKKAIQQSHILSESDNKISVYKRCEECEATWVVIYNLVPLKISDMEK